MSEPKTITVEIEVEGDSENSPDEALHHALTKLYHEMRIKGFSDPIAGYAELEADRDAWRGWAYNAFLHLIAPEPDTPTFAVRLREELVKADMFPTSKREPS